MTPQSENKVLVVNDSADQLELIRVLLGAEGYNVSTAEDGSKGFQVAQRERPHLVVSDVCMPNTNGIDLCRQMRADRDLQTTPILLVSALRKGADSVIEGLEAGADDYLEAPYESMVLTTKVAQLTERKRAADALRESENKYRMLVEQASDGILIFDQWGSLLEMNSKARELLATDHQETRSLNIRDLILNADLAASILQLEDLRRGETVRLEGRLRCLDGTLVPVESSAKALADGRLQVIIRDITERIRSVEAQERLQAELRRSETMAAMGRLIAAVAHEVRSPLFGISATLDAFEHCGANDEDRQEYINVLRGEVHRLNDLMNELLEYGRPASEEHTKEPIGDCIAQAICSCAPLAAKQKVTILNKVEQGFAPVRMERRRLPQVFVNILQNAIQHSSPGETVTVEAEVVCHEDGNRVECSIKDCGPGFQAEDLPRIFEPFFRRRRGGTGLGLSIVQRIVEEHGGSISAGNRPEGGAVLVVSLPLVAVHSAASGG